MLTTGSAGRLPRKCEQQRIVVGGQSLSLTTGPDLEFSLKISPGLSRVTVVGAHPHYLGLQKMKA